MPRVRWLCGAALLAVLTSCAAVPTSGPVHVAKALPEAVGGNDFPNVRQVPPGPIVGTTAVGLVGGYLDALLNSDNDYGVARLFLATGTSWNAASGITLYDDNSTAISRNGPNRVQVTVDRVGVIDAQGSYRPAPGPLTVQIGIVRQDGQWRISRVPAGVLLSTADAQRSLQPVALYYFNRGQSRLVPEPILASEPDQPGLATTLISKLLAGPSRALAPAVATALPAGTSLIGNVPIDSNGTAEINLGGSIQPSPAQLERLSAQIAWTLRQLPGVTGIRLLNNGSALTNAGPDSPQPVGAWPQFDPATPPTSDGALLSHRGEVVAINRSVPGPLERRTLGAPAVSADGAMVAALRSGSHGMRLLVGSVNGPLRARVRSPHLSAPSFDPQGDAVVVSGTEAGSIVTEVPREGRTREVDVSPEIRDEGISALAISRDGSRVAMTVGAPGHEELVVATVSTTQGALVFNGGVVVIPATQDVRGVAWAGANTIVTTAKGAASGRVVLETTVDGYSVHDLTSSGLAADPTQVAAAPGQPLLTGAGGRVWSLSGRRWKRVAVGRDPAYAG